MFHFKSRAAFFYIIIYQALKSVDSLRVLKGIIVILLFMTNYLESTEIDIKTFKVFNDLKRPAKF